jgi:environmental stress-induced protein Ves
MRILRAADHKRMPWKNGKGETVEIAVFPPGADVDSFDWRISTATVAEDGAFSVFEGIDRTLSILTGEGMELSVEGRAPVLLDQLSESHAFPGDAPTTARLTGGAITDLNVMTRRGSFAHRVDRIAGPKEVTTGPRSGQTVVVVTGEAMLSNEPLGAIDAILLDQGDDALSLTFAEETAVFIIEIRPVGED